MVGFDIEKLLVKVSGEKVENFAAEYFQSNANNGILEKAAHEKIFR